MDQIFDLYLAYIIEHSITIMKANRLNNFILWCKGWYESTNDSKDYFNEVKEILKLDGYEFARNKQDVLSIVLHYMDDLIDAGIISSSQRPLKMAVWHSELQKYIIWMKGDYDLATLCVIRDFFRFSITRKDIKLDPPVYSRKVYKMGFVCPRIYGNSYKLCNHKVKKLFNNFNNQSEFQSNF